MAAWLDKRLLYLSTLLFPLVLQVPAIEGQACALCARLGHPRVAY